MRKWLLIIGIVSSLMLSGCEASKEQKQNLQAIDTVTITVFTKYNEYDSFIKMIEEYNQSQEKINIVLLETEQMEYHQQLNLLFTSGQIPDIFTIESDWISGYLYNNWLKDLAPYEELLGFKEYPDWSMEYVKSRYTEDTIYAVPLSLVTYRFAWNKSIFLKTSLNPDLPPKNLKEMVDMSYVISKQFTGKGVFGMILPLKQGTDCFEKVLEQPSTYSDRYYYDPESGKYNFLSYKDWFKIINQMSEDGGLMQGSENMDMETAVNQFCLGNAGMVYLTSEEYRMFCNNKSQELSVGIAMPPLYEDTQVETKQNISLDLCYAVYRKCKNPEQAMEILQMLTSAEMLQSSFSDLLFIPVKSSPEDQLQFFKEFAPNSDDVNNKIIYPPNSLDWKRTDVYTQVLVDPAMMEALLVEESTILNKSPNAFRSRNVK